MLMLALAGIAGATTSALSAQVAGCSVNPSELSIDAEEQVAIDGINALRSAGGMSALSLSATLTQAAAHKSALMAATGSLNHDDPGRTWLQRVQECGYRASQTVSENLAVGTETGRATVQMWRESPPHARNMMDPALRAVGLA